MKIVRINKTRHELRAHPFHCSIVLPILDAKPGQGQNVVFHVGKPKYIANLWNRKFANREQMISPTSLDALQKFEAASFRMKNVK
jgi:hypothetical protein